MFTHPPDRNARAALCIWWRHGQTDSHGENAWGSCLNSPGCIALSHRILTISSFTHCVNASRLNEQNPAISAL